MGDHCYNPTVKILVTIVVWKDVSPVVRSFEIVVISDLRGRTFSSSIDDGRVYAIVVLVDGPDMRM